MKHMIMTLLQNHVFYVFSIVTPTINMNKFTYLIDYKIFSHQFCPFEKINIYYLARLTKKFNQIR